MPEPRPACYSLAEQVAEVVLGDALEPENSARGTAPSASTAPALDPEGPLDPELYPRASFDAVAGRYSLDVAPAFILHFFREGDTLFTQATGQPKIRIRPTSASSFALVGVAASVTVHRNENGEVSHATLHQSGDHRATRLEGSGGPPRQPSSRRTPVGTTATSWETFYTVALEEGELVVGHRRFEDVELQPGETDAFAGGFAPGLREVHAGPGRAGHRPLASSGRTRDIRFQRVPYRRSGRQASETASQESRGGENVNQGSADPSDRERRGQTY